MTLSKPVVSLSQCHAAIEAMIAEYNTDPSRRPLDMAIVDDGGNLLAYARMDKCRRPTFAMNKAYTAAIRGATTGAFGEMLKGQGRNVSEFGDARFTVIPGGVPIVHSDGTIMGAVGVGGFPTGEEDAKISEAGIKAMKVG